MTQDSEQKLEVAIRKIFCYGQNFTCKNCWNQIWNAEGNSISEKITKKHSGELCVSKNLCWIWPKSYYKRFADCNFSKSFWTIHNPESIKGFYKWMWLYMASQKLICIHFRNQ